LHFLALLGNNFGRNGGGTSLSRVVGGAALHINYRRISNTFILIRRSFVPTPMRAAQVLIRK